MNKSDLWLLFAKTGKIEYYLRYKNYKDEREVETENEQKN